MITVNEEKAESKSTTIQKTLDKKDEAKSEVKVKKVLSNVSEELNKKIEETARSPKVKNKQKFSVPKTSKIQRNQVQKHMLRI